jgi:hypothetical protein
MEGVPKINNTTDVTLPNDTSPERCERSEGPEIIVEMLPGTEP